MRQFKPTHRPGHARGAVAELACVRGFTGCIQVHIGRGRQRCALAEVEKRGASIGEADQHESAATYVAGLRVRHRQREAHGHRGVHRVAARSQDGHADIGRVSFAAHHHGVPHAHWLSRP